MTGHELVAMLGLAMCFAAVGGLVDGLTRVALWGAAFGTALSLVVLAVAAVAS